jgi:hypothetical protein
MRGSMMALLLLALTGCAANSGIVSMGQETFMVSRQAATGFSGSGNLKAQALSEAGLYCTERSKLVFVTDTTEAQPPYVMGNFPKVEIHFMCLNANDPRLASSHKP